MITDRQKVALTSSPKTRNSNAPDPTWKAQQAFIRATRRGSKKHSSMEQKLELVDSAIAAIRPAAKVVDEEAAKQAAKSRDLGRALTAELARRATLTPKP